VIADAFNGSATHLAHHDVMLCAVSRAPLPKLNAYKQRMGWTFPWASSFGSDSTDSPGLWHHAVASLGQPLTDQAPRPDRKRVSRGTSSGRHARPPQYGSYRGSRERRAMM
jgi:Bacterial protein of unknown function (DUF899)